MALAIYIPTLGGFIGIYLKGSSSPDELSESIIFSIIELMISFMILIYDTVMAMGFLVELNVVLERFSSLYNSKNEQMMIVSKKDKQAKATKRSSKNSRTKTSKKGLKLKLKNYRRTDSSHSFINDDMLLDINNVEAYDDDLQKGDIHFQDFEAFWSQNSKEPALKQINIKIMKGLFYGIFGGVGSGKSTFFHSII